MPPPCHDSKIGGMACFFLIFFSLFLLIVVRNFFHNLSQTSLPSKRDKSWLI